MVAQCNMECDFLSDFDRERLDAHMSLSIWNGGCLWRRRFRFVASGRLPENDVLNAHLHDFYLAHKSCTCQD